MLTRLDALPPGLVDLPARRLHERLPGPTLIHLPGRREPALFVSVLLHGNEDTGWEAIRRLLDRYRDRELPRALSLFIGNVSAAARGLRRLDHQPDYNRIWPSGPDTPHTGPEADMLRQVLDDLERQGLFAAVDIHNNTGPNPHYTCITVLDHRYVHLALLFSRTVVYFTGIPGMASRALSRLCPAVTLECGQPGQGRGVSHALEFLEACLHLSELPGHPVPPQDLDLFHTMAVVRLNPGTSLAFGQGEADLVLAEDLERLNFQEVPMGTVLGWLRGGPLPVTVTGADGEDLTRWYLDNEDGQLRLLRPVMPAMLTRDARVIRQDCLCYLMERHGPQRVESSIRPPPIPARPFL